MLLKKENHSLEHINSITHDGKVLVFALGSDGTIFYTVRVDGFENQLDIQRQLKDWENWQVLPMPDGETDASVLDFEEKNYTSDDGQIIMRSIYDPGKKSVNAPVQLISGLGYLYVFRQSEEGYLLVDRFVLDGLNNRLIRKLEIRYKRSRKKYEPEKAPSGKANIRFDALNFRDANGQPFYEPTIELNLQASMLDGWFNVLLLPTENLDEHLWHFFFCNESEELCCTSVRASAEGLFDLKDHADQKAFEINTFKLTVSQGNNLIITGPPAVTKYDIQEEAQKDDTTHLLRTATRVMLVVPTDQGIASLDFSVAADGRLSHLGTDRTSMPPELLRGKARILKLPPDTLKKIRAYSADGTPAKGRILGMQKTADGRIKLLTAKGDPVPKSSQIFIQGSQSFNGLYEVQHVDRNSFEIKVPLAVSDAAEVQGDYVIGVLNRAVKKGHKTLRLAASLPATIAASTVLQVMNGAQSALTFKVRKDSSAGTKTIWIEPADTTAPAGLSVYHFLSSDHPKIRHKLGEWKEAPPESEELTGTGAITALRPTESGTLGLNARHDLRSGDKIEITTSGSTNGWFEVLKVDAEGIVLDAPWRGGKVINRSERDYSGIQMSGKGERFDIALTNEEKIGCLEVRFKTQKRDGLQLTFHGKLTDERGVFQAYMSVQLEMKDGVPYLYLIPYTGENHPRFELGFGGMDFADGQWHHLSYVWGVNTDRHDLYLDGVANSLKIPFLDRHSFHCSNVESDIYSPEKGPEFEGQLAELRLWNQARTQSEIEEALYRKLSGREVGLSGYWPMGVISDGNKLLDISENQNHGFTTGHVFVPGIQLERDENTVEFVNETLISVTQGAAYTESFEFRPHGATTHDRDLFSFKYQGKRSRNSEQWTGHEAFNAQVHENSGEGLTNGWQKASCSFIVPEGVSLLRSFGINQLGQWDRMEIRNLSIRLTSNSISKQQFTQQTDFPDLTPGFDGGAQDLKELENKELQAYQLQSKLDDLSEYTSAQAIESKREELEDNITRMEPRIEKLKSDIEKEKAALLNKWHEIKLVNTPWKMGVDPSLSSANELPLKVLLNQPEATKEFEKFGFIRSFDNEGYYQLLCQYQNRYIYYLNGRVRVLTTEEAKLANQAPLEFTLVESQGKYKLKTLDEKYFSVVDNKFFSLEAAIHSGVTIQLIPREELINVRLKSYEARYHIYLRDQSWWEAALEVFNDLFPKGKTNAEVQANVSTITKNLNELKDSIEALRSKLSTDSEALQQGLPLQKLSGLLPLQSLGGLLKLPDPGSRLHLLASADGNIWLNYFDRHGQHNQCYYDAINSSTNTTFETWILPSFRSCLDVGPSGAAVKLTKEIPLVSEWTIECRFFYPFPEKPKKDRYKIYDDVDAFHHVLIGNGSEDRLFSNRNLAILVRERSDGRQELGTYFENHRRDVAWHPFIFYPCNFNMRSLTNGWHHLTVVGHGYGANSNTLFYIDGEKVGDIKQAAPVSLENAPSFPEQEKPAAKARVASLEVMARIQAPINAIGNIVPSSQHYASPGTQAGKLAELRVWEVALSPEEVEINASIAALNGDEPGLKAYFPLNGDASDLTGNGYDGKMVNAIPGKIPAEFIPFTGQNRQLTVGNYIPASIISNEYNTVSLDPVTGEKNAMLRRFIGYPTNNGIQLLSQQRIAELELLWIGNAQINPTLLGFIEGAPPVPSENLTEDPPSYQGATAVELITEEELSFSWNREDTSSLGLSLDLFVGAAGSVSFLGLGGVSYKVGVSGGLALSNTSFNQSNIGSSARSTNTDRLELRGYPETKAHFPNLGPRFVPKNIGYALVVSGTADVYITRLKKTRLKQNGRMIAYTVQPSPDIPLDVNTITFLINPAYTMNGSLDGLTGTRPTSDRFFEHVLEMRAQYGSAFPASYYRVQEAYELKEMIEKQDKERAAYFANFDIRDLEGAIDRATGDEPEDDEDTERIAKEKQEEMEQRIEDEEARAHAFSAFASWQRKMEDLQIKAGKRNIVNTYVWDADGGLRVEEQQFAGTIEHTVGGSFEFSGALGVSGEVEASGFGVGIGAALTLEATLSMSQTMSKTEASGRALSLVVDLSGVESQGITDFRDTPLLPGEKVDRYRFMSFYLEGSSQHFEDFFNEVVDPEWLAGNDEEARALRQARQGKPNKTWRVLHRVTYVERPALKGFGNDS